MLNHDTVIAVYSTHTAADLSIKEIQKSGFDMKKLSIIGKDYHNEEHVVGFYNTEDRMLFWGKLGAFWGAAWGLFFGSALFVVPGIGPVMVFGPLGGWLLAGLESAMVVGGLSALGAGLYGLGIKKDSIVQYESDIKAGKFLLLAHGTPDELEQVQSICGAHSERVQSISGSHTEKVSFYDAAPYKKLQKPVRAFHV
jgi:hypothetical protein